MMNKCEKLICDIGTNVYNIEATKMLLPHFLSHYDDLGVTQYILHGSDILCELLDNNGCFSGHNVVLKPITNKQYEEYYEKQFDLYYHLVDQNTIHEKNVSMVNDRTRRMCRKRNTLCPLWLIQNDIKKQMIEHDEWCYILDLDEFVEIPEDDLNDIITSNATHVTFDLVDRVHESGNILPLKESPNILDQFNMKVWLTKKMNRYTDKVCMTYGHNKHSYGHHFMYNKKDDRSYQKKYPVWHCKWSEQSATPPEKAFNKDQYRSFHKHQDAFIRDNKIIVDLNGIMY